MLLFVTDILKIRTMTNIFISIGDGTAILMVISLLTTFIRVVITLRTIIA